MSKFKYGKYWTDDTTDIMIELWCWRTGRGVAEGGLGKFQHGKNCIDLLWNYEGSESPIKWNPWLEKQLTTIWSNQVVVMGGGSSCAKSLSMAIDALLNYFSSPTNTSCFITSTSITDAKQRIFKDIMRLWRSEFPGRLVESKGAVRGVNPEGKITDTSGIFIIPCVGVGDPKSKFVGKKAINLHVYFDELSELPISLVDAWRYNLKSNAQGSPPTLVAASNPASKVDAFGILSKPKNGWSSVDLDNDEEWETEDGIYLRFDTSKNPRITYGREDWNFFISKEEADNLREGFGGENTSEYKRYVKATFSNEMENDVLITEQDIFYNRADEKPIWGSDELVRVAGIDPSYTHGGDKTRVAVGEYGLDIDGHPTLSIVEIKLIADSKKAQDERNRNTLVCQNIADYLKKMKVKTENVALDVTGEGGFSDILAGKIGNTFYPVNFGGRASKQIISKNKPIPASELYWNRVSEIWGVVKLAISCHQLKNLPPDAIADFTARRRKLVNGSKICVESKKEMKARIKRSPDAGDAVAVMVDFVRHRYNGQFGLTPKLNNYARNKEEVYKTTIRQGENGVLYIQRQMYDDIFGTPEQKKKTVKEQLMEARKKLYENL
jgi:hypothetical protein